MTWVLREAWRNLVSGTTHALRYMLVVQVTLGLVVLAELSTVDTILVRAAGYRSSGASVVTLEAPGLIDGASCDALGRLPGVQAAGALRADERPLVPSVLPRGPMSAYIVTDGLLALVGADQDHGTGIVLAQQVSTTLDRPIGAELATTSGITRVRGTYAWPDDGRRAGFSFAALIPASAHELYDECWVQAWPIPTNLPALLRLTAIPATDGTSQVTLGRLNTTLGTSFDGASDFSERVTSLAWATASLTGLLVGITSVRSRRLELASARHVGVSRTAQHLQILVEAGVWSAATAVLLAGTVTVIVGRSSGHDDATLLTAAAHVVLPGLISVILGSQIAVTATRERHLFRYFKNR